MAGLRFFALLWSIAAIAALTARPADAATAGMFGHNLVVNGDAESGAALPQHAPVPGWKTTGHFIAVTYGYDGYPAVVSPGPVDRGKHFFSGGERDQLSTATQRIDLTPARADIDAGTVWFAFSAYIGGWGAQEDRATVTATLVDKNGRAVGLYRLGPVTAAERKRVTGLWPRAVAHSLPKGTRGVVVTIVARRYQGASNDGYVDNVSFSLRKH